MRTLAWASFLTLGIPAPGKPGSGTVAVAGSQQDHLQQWPGSQPAV